MSKPKSIKQNSGYTPMKSQPGASIYAAGKDNLPSIVDLRKQMTKVENQGSVSFLHGERRRGCL